jgi:hypothetical protein
MDRSMPSIEWLIPDYNKTETKMVSIRNQFQPNIHKFCEDMRLEKNEPERCFCKLHPDYEQWQRLINPTIVALDMYHAQYRLMRNEHRDKYEKILIESKHAKERYAATCF